MAKEKNRPEEIEEVTEVEETEVEETKAKLSTKVKAKARAVKDNKKAKVVGIGAIALGSLILGFLGGRKSKKEEPEVVEADNDYEETEETTEE